jgi:hypothetical protein|tara:strand:+ start:3931 stop:4548 length:618 start_codon:yes stop_codon:yes gene_type:complete
MRKYLILFLSFFSIIGCIVVPKRVINNFNDCFDGKETGLDSLINIKGFYYLGKDYNNISTGEFLFYDNGFVHTRNGEYWLKQDFEDSKYGSFGKYTVSNDTIKTYIVSDPLGMGVNGYKVWFKIINYNSIELIYRGDTKNITEFNIERSKENIKADSYYKERGTIYKFSPIKSKPDINKTYIMNKKWFWCNEESYKKWKNKKKNE